MKMGWMGRKKTMVSMMIVVYLARVGNAKSAQPFYFNNQVAGNKRTSTGSRKPLTWTIFLIFYLKPEHKK